MKAREEGYILASVTVVMVILSMSAAALVAASAAELRRVARLERQHDEEGLLRSAVIVAASQLVLAPHQRSLNIRDGAGVVNIEGRSVSIRVSYESDKIDLNQARLDVVRDQARNGRLSSSDISQFMAVLGEMASNDEPVRLIDDVLSDGLERPECIHSLFTVFGGRSDVGPMRDLHGEFDRPAAGSRLSITARLLDNSYGVSAVLLMTGQRTEPARIMDLRWHDVEVNNEAGGCGDEA